MERVADQRGSRKGQKLSQPVIIVGAPRSGTNILRDVLTSVSGFETWPCDEINLVWKHHNRSIPHDELDPTHARPEVTEYLRGVFNKLSRKTQPTHVVEKTCATSLRVGFAAAVFPEAKFVFIRRDGLDAAASTIQRWDAPFDARYIARKLRYAPKSDLPFYATQFLAKRRASRQAERAGRTSGARRVDSWWGPKPHDYVELQHQHSLDELAIVQWQRCVEASVQDLATLPQGQVHEVVYESFAQDPATTMRGILDFLESERSVPDDVLASVSPHSIGKGRTSFDTSTTQRLTDLASKTLSLLGYA